MTSEDNAERQGVLEGLLATVQAIKESVEDILDEIEHLENGRPFYKDYDPYQTDLDLYNEE